MIEIDQAEVNFDNNIKDIVEDYNHNMNLWFVATKVINSQEQYVLLAHKFHSGKVSVYDSLHSKNNTAPCKDITMPYKTLGIVFVFYAKIHCSTLANKLS